MLNIQTDTILFKLYLCMYTYYVLFYEGGLVVLWMICVCVVEMYVLGGVLWRLCLHVESLGIIFVVCTKLNIAKFSSDVRSGVLLQGDLLSDLLFVWHVKLYAISSHCNHNETQHAVTMDEKKCNVIT